MNDADAEWEVSKVQIEHKLKCMCELRRLCACQASDLDLSIPAGTKEIVCSYLSQFEEYTQCDCEEWTQERLSYHQMLKRQRLRSVIKLQGKGSEKVDILESNTCVSFFKSLILPPEIK